MPRRCHWSVSAPVAWPVWHCSCCMTMRHPCLPLGDRTMRQPWCVVGGSTICSRVVHWGAVDLSPYCCISASQPLLLAVDHLIRVLPPPPSPPAARGPHAESPARTIGIVQTAPQLATAPHPRPIPPHRTQPVRLLALNQDFEETASHNTVGRLCLYRSEDGSLGKF